MPPNPSDWGVRYIFHFVCSLALFGRFVKEGEGGLFAGEFRRISALRAAALRRLRSAPPGGLLLVLRTNSPCRACGRSDRGDRDRCPRRGRMRVRSWDAFRPHREPLRFLRKRKWTGQNGPVWDWPLRERGNRFCIHRRGGSMTRLPSLPPPRGKVAGR